MLVGSWSLVLVVASIISHRHWFSKWSWIKFLNSISSHSIVSIRVIILIHHESVVSSIMCLGMVESPSQFDTILLWHILLSPIILLWQIWVLIQLFVLTGLVTIGIIWRFFALIFFFLEFISVWSSANTIHHESTIGLLCCFELLFWYIAFLILDQDLVFSLDSFFDYLLFHNSLTLSELLDHPFLFLNYSVFLKVFTTQFLFLLFSFFINFCILIIFIHETGEGFWSFSFYRLSNRMNLSIFRVHVWVNVILW